MRVVNKVIRQDDVDRGDITLNEILSLMDDNRLRAQRFGMKLSWQFKLGVYYSYIKKDNEVLYYRHYHHRQLINALIYMHLDFKDYLDMGSFRKKKE
jgi:hypothetical protein